jgi:DNA-binding CsgD family transcriptional regulator
MSDLVASVPADLRHPTLPNSEVASGAVAYIDNWLRRLPWAVVVVSEGLHCLWVNPAAQALAEQGKIELAGGRLAIGDATATDSLRAFVARVGSQPETWVTKTRQGDHLVVRADTVEPDNLPSAVALIIKCTSEMHRHSVWADLQSAFGLTRSEAMIVIRLVDGDSADDIAASLGLAVDTVRSHIRRTYIKLDIGSREQLFAKVLPFRIG